MLCEKCKIKPATVHIERIINYAKTEYNLCFSCAVAMDAEMSFDNIIKEFLGQVIELEKGTAFSAAQREPEAPVCPSCNLSYGEFRESGKLGCAECYKAFAQQLDAVLKNIHGSGEHLGKIPRSASDEILQKRELKALRQQLREAIDNEEYEAAADLRDRIRFVESGRA